MKTGMTIGYFLIAAVLVLAGASVLVLASIGLAWLVQQ
jgi:hypothetical protein